MTTAIPVAGTPGSSRLRSTAAVLVAFISVAVLSLAVDQLFHELDVYPPWGQPMYAPGLNLLALSYRILFAIGGGYIAAALAPHSPMRHVRILAVIGSIAASLGAIGAIAVGNLGPNWYPILLALTAYPTTWLGGALHQRFVSN